MSGAKYNEALSKYYTLKRQYDDKYTAAKNKLLKNPTLSMGDKRRKLAQIKQKCVHCGKPGGTLFSNNDGVLSAACGNTAKPCSLNIRIVRAQYMPSYEVLEKFGHDINETKGKVVAKKYDMLFGYTDEGVALEEFQALKKDLAHESVIYEAAMDKYNEATGTLSQKEQLRIKEVEKYQIIQSIRNLLSEYKTDGERSQMEQVIDAYVNRLQPVLDEIRRLKYAYVGMEYDEATDTNQLIEKVFTDRTMEFQLKKGSVEAKK